MMIVGKVSAINNGSSVDLSARVCFENHQGEPLVLWIKIPSDMGNSLSGNGDIFLAATLLPCMMAGESHLCIEDPVSPRLLAVSSHIQTVYTQFWPQAKRITIVADQVVQKNANGERVAQFFSGGVDSFYSLLKNKEMISDLLFVHGFDISLTDHERFQATKEVLARVAAQTGKRLIEIRTNLRDLSERLGIKWDVFHGAAMISVGLALGGDYEKIIIPASHSFDALFPWGSHPMLDPCWSTEYVEFIHDGCELKRSEKIIDWICRSDTALANLRVCWRRGAKGLNCGVCEKCLRTKIALYTGGGLVNCLTFDNDLRPAAVRRLRLSKKNVFYFAADNIQSLEKKDMKTKYDRKLLGAMITAVRKGRRRLALRMLLRLVDWGELW